MDMVRFGVIGLGNMGSAHLNILASVKGAVLAGICDTDAGRLQMYWEKYPAAAAFATHEQMLQSGNVDAVIVATPHYEHPVIARAAFARGIHVLSEKPVAVDVKKARATDELYRTKYGHLKYGVVFQLRTSPVYRKIREMVMGGLVGEISRVSWVITDSFRTWTYYASGGWRATWKGEGGGVLLNQCPHYLDLVQWVLGDVLPTRVTAVAFIAKAHPIEVEDEVSAIMEYENGAIGHFMASTGEGLGTNRLEIVGDRGRLLSEGGKLIFHQAGESARDVLRNSPKSFVSVAAVEKEVELDKGQAEGHGAIVQNFADAVLRDEPLIAPGVEGVRGLELGNAMLMSGVRREAVELPVDGERYQGFLREMAEKYGGRKSVVGVKEAKVDMKASFGH